MIMFLCKRFLCVAVCVCLLVSAGNAGTSTLYNNLPPTYSSAGFDNVGYAGADIQVGPLADSFSTGAGGFTMNDIQLNLLLDNSPASSIQVLLVNDNGGTPVGGILGAESSLTALSARLVELSTFRSRQSLWPRIPDTG